MTQANPQSVPPPLARPVTPPFAPGVQSLSPHGIATELSDIRREIARLKRREAALLSGEPGPTGRPGWPMQRLTPARD